jgi:hypothetical protein
MPTQAAAGRRGRFQCLAGRFSLRFLWFRRSVSDTSFSVGFSIAVEQPLQVDHFDAFVLSEPPEQLALAELNSRSSLLLPYACSVLCRSARHRRKLLIIGAEFASRSGSSSFLARSLAPPS